MSGSVLPDRSDVDVQVVMWCQCGQSFQTSLPYKDISAENIYDLNLRVWAHVQGAPRGKWGPYHMSWEDVTKARVTIHNDEMTEDYKMPKLSGSHPLLCGVVPLVQCMRLKKKRTKEIQPAHGYPAHGYPAHGYPAHGYPAQGRI